MIEIELLDRLETPADQAGESAGHQHPRYLRERRNSRRWTTELRSLMMTNEANLLRIVDLSVGGLAATGSNIICENLQPGMLLRTKVNHRMFTNPIVLAVTWVKAPVVGFKLVSTEPHVKEAFESLLEPFRVAQNLRPVPMRSRGSRERTFNFESDDGTKLTISLTSEGELINWHLSTKKWTMRCDNQADIEFWDQHNRPRPPGTQSLDFATDILSALDHPVATALKATVRKIREYR